jgi:hypothetical protein
MMYPRSVNSKVIVWKDGSPISGARKKAMTEESTRTTGKTKNNILINRGIGIKKNPQVTPNKKNIYIYINK